MSKYRVIKEYRSILGRIMYVVQRKDWPFWSHISFEFSQKKADDLIKYLKSEGL